MTFITLLTSCSQPQPAGKRVSLAKGNISFVLPDSSLVYRKPMLWPGDYHLSDYGEAGAFYQNPDSTLIVDVYVKAYPDTLQSSSSWRVIANEKRRCQELSDKNHGLMVIEKYSTDSLLHTIEINYHVPKSQESGWLGRPSYEKSFTIYGRHRIITFWFVGPDSPTSRKRFSACQASVRVDPVYLQAVAKPLSEYKD